MNEDTVPIEVQRAILTQEIQMWLNSRYLFEIRIRVTRRIGGDATPIVAELEKCEKALDALSEILEETSA
jgi:hypothetical protein